MSHATEPPTASWRRITIFRVLAILTGLLFVFAGLTNARAGWMLVVGATGDAHPEANRWFTTVAGTSDLIGAACLLALAWRPILSLLFSFTGISFVVAAVINLPFVPEFAVVLAVVAPVLVAYPYWAQLRMFLDWWRRPHVVLLILATSGAVVLLVLAAIDVTRQVSGTDAAAQSNWWADYAEHITLVALAGLLAGTGRPGWRLLGGFASAAWIYLGVVAAFTLPDHTASWGSVGGVAAILLGAAMAVVCIRGQSEQRESLEETPWVR
jgi:hypothetical protein